MTNASDQRYLELLKRALLHTLYWPPDIAPLPAHLEVDFKKEFAAAEARGEPINLDFAQARLEGRDWPKYAQTMVGRDRLDNVHECVQSVIDDGVQGDLIECGVWRGGAAMLMQAVLTVNDARDRKMVLADSFAGLPVPDAEQYPADADDKSHTAKELAIPRKVVEDNFERYDLAGDNLEFHEGWFKDTLPSLNDRTWAVVRLDGDLYESTMDGLVHLHDNVADGGFVIIDDYGYEPCRKAVHDFRDERGITDAIQIIDWAGAFWRRAGG